MIVLGLMHAYYLLMHHQSNGGLAAVRDLSAEGQKLSPTASEVSAKDGFQVQIALCVLPNHECAWSPAAAPTI